MSVNLSVSCAMAIAKTERHYQVVFYLVFKLMGQFTEAEVRSAKGRELIKVGVEFNAEERNIGRWLVS